MKGIIYKGFHLPLKAQMPFLSPSPNLPWHLFETKRLFSLTGELVSTRTVSGMIYFVAFLNKRWWFSYVIGERNAFDFKSLLFGKHHNLSIGEVFLFFYFFLALEDLRKFWSTAQNSMYNFFKKLVILFVRCWDRAGTEYLTHTFLTALLLS